MLWRCLPFLYFVALDCPDIRGEAFDKVAVVDDGKDGPFEIGKRL
jgi:hypothetical protein